MHLREADIGEERLAGRGVALDEIGGPCGDLFVEERPRLQVEVRHRRDRRSFHPFPDLRHGKAGFGEQRVGAIAGSSEVFLMPNHSSKP